MNALQSFIAPDLARQLAECQDQVKSITRLLDASRAEVAEERDEQKKTLIAWFASNDAWRGLACAHRNALQLAIGSMTVNTTGEPLDQFTAIVPVLQSALALTAGGSGVPTDALPRTEAGK